MTTACLYRERNVNRLIILHSVLALGLVGCNEQRSTSIKGQDQVDLTAVNGEAMPSGPAVTMWIKGMSCPFCATNLEDQLRRIPGVGQVVIDLGTGRVVVALDTANPPSKDQLAKAVDDSGFTLDGIDMP